MAPVTARRRPASAVPILLLLLAAAALRLPPAALVSVLALSTPPSSSASLRGPGRSSLPPPRGGGGSGGGGGMSAPKNGEEELTEEELEGTTVETCDVVVLGAGPAGIASALRLESLAGHGTGSSRPPSVAVLEIRDRIGGRAHSSDELGAGVVLDHGAKWIHGACDENRMWRLWKEEEEEQQLRRRRRNDWDGGGGGDEGFGPKRRLSSEELTVARLGRSNVTRVVVPSSEEDGDATAEAKDPSPDALKAADYAFARVQEAARYVAVTTSTGDGDGGLGGDLTLEECLRKVHADCVPPPADSDSRSRAGRSDDGDDGDDGGATAFDPDHERRRTFYANFLRKVLSESEADEHDLSPSFLSEASALLNLRIYRFYESWEGAPLRRISARHGLETTELPGFGNAEVPGGYGTFVSRLGRPLLERGVVRLRHGAVRVRTFRGDDDDGDEHDGARVEVECVVGGDRRDGEGAKGWRRRRRRTFRARACIVALPLGVLRDGVDAEEEEEEEGGRQAISFDPPLPPAVVRAVKTLGIAVMNKVELSFPKRWWPSDVGSLTVASSLPDRSPTYHPFSHFVVESAGTDDEPHRPNVLVCYLAGDFAERVESWDDATVSKRCLEALKRADFWGRGRGRGDREETKIPDPTAVHVTRWRSDPASRGTWTFYAAGSGGSDVVTRAFRGGDGGGGGGGTSPADECTARGLFFAGEHTCDGSVDGLDMGCVHGAWLSGELAAERVWKDVLSS